MSHQNPFGLYCVCQRLACHLVYGCIFGAMLLIASESDSETF